MFATCAGDNQKEDHTMADVKVLVDGSLEDDGTAFVDAWHRTERGETLNERVLAFESWEGLARVMTGERYRLLRHVHDHPEPSVSALARALGRQYRRVHADVAALEQAGLPDRAEGGVRATADRIHAEIAL
jgi:predicted transcriptional regulator